MSDRDMPSGAKKFGYFVTILINIAMVYVANNLLNWNIPVLTDAFNDCLWAINLSFAVTIFINFIFMVFDRKWFHSLMEAFSSVFSFVSGYVFWQVFPLDLTETWAHWVNVGLIILLILILISILSQILNAGKYYRHDSGK